jgi:hypothetical protein
MGQLHPRIAFYQLEQGPGTRVIALFGTRGGLVSTWRARTNAGGGPGRAPCSIVWGLFVSRALVELCPGTGNRKEESQKKT